MRLLVVAFMAVAAMAVAVSAAAPAAPAVSTTAHSAPLGVTTINAAGQLVHPVANPATENGPAPVVPNAPKPPKLHNRRQKNKAPKAKKPAKPAVIETYRPGTDYIGTFAAVPVNPAVHLQQSLAEDKLYVASILRAPADLGDPTNCKHGDVEKNELELKRIAIRINARRVALRQQQEWIDSATDGLRKIETEIEQTTATARNLAEQMDALTAQKEDITNHVRRAILLKELDHTSSNLMRLKDSRMMEEVTLQKKHNQFALRNVAHNSVLAKLHKMRTKQGLALGKLADPKPYRFAQAGMDAAAEEANQMETETDADQEDAAENESESEVEADAEVEQAADQEAEAE